MDIHEELRYISRYDDDDLTKNDLRLMVEWLCKDERLLRSFRIYFVQKDKHE